MSGNNCVNCPKCGGKSNAKASYPWWKWKEFRVVCDNCGFRTTPHFEKEDAQIEWCELCEYKERMTDDA